ncbi:MAG: flagellar hook-associated protein FlgL [Woeseia sp.]|nr:flagellar hook-associated protein FlgL [Woeseia sp.]NNE60046.1 flagellar hook-associated protein FlgL [Woeseia sp.]
MRISSNSSFERGLGMMQQLQVALDRTQQQISSGRRLLSPSDDPIAAARTVEMRESLARMEQFDRNGEIARNRLSYEESTLVSVNDVLQRVRELALQANNDTQSPDTRAQIAGEMRDRVDQLVALANQRDGTGRYLFSGNRDATTPVSESNGLFSYNGDQGQRLIQIGEDRQIADGDSGAAVFFSVKAGNGTFATRAAAANTGQGLLGTSSVTDRSQYDQDTYTLRFTGANSYDVLDSGGGVVSSAAFAPGDTVAFRGIEFSLSGEPAAGDEFIIEPSRNLDMFSIVQDLVGVLEQPAQDDQSRAALHNGVNSALQNIDQAIGQVLSVRTQVGSRLSAIESQAETNGSLSLTLQSTVSSIEDLDYAEALSNLSLQISTLEAAQQSFIRTQGLSLFNYL